MYHSPKGHEAICAAVGVNLRANDYVVTTYRGMGDQVARGVPFKLMWAEYFGKATGANKGKGGPMHITCPDVGLMLTTGIVGSGLPIANGYALASTLKGTDQVTVCNFGDGATNIGAFHEALNLAQLWNLPVVFVCHNNGYAEHTAVAEHQMNAHVSDRAPGYGMRGVTVNGLDPVEVATAVRTAMGHARRGEGPTLIEAISHRLAGHFIGDSVPAEVRALGDAADPVPQFRARVIASGAASEGSLAALEASIEAELDDAVEFALNSPYPDLDELGIDVYAQAMGVAQ
jgi:pyruvate dehydrogenase E1 component alpha subunit